MNTRYSEETTLDIIGTLLNKKEKLKREVNSISARIAGRE